MYSFEKIIDEPVHGRKFYSQEEIELLNQKINTIIDELHIQNYDIKEIIHIVLKYIKENVLYKKTYFDCFTKKVEFFDESYLKYRTAYGALVKGEAMCAGYAEAIRVLLDAYNIKSYTLLSKLPLERKKLLHYVVAVKEEDNMSVLVLDPESEQYCKKNGYNYEDYINNSIFTIPTKLFTDDVVGTDGAGILATEYISHSDIPRVRGLSNIDELLKMADLKFDGQVENSFVLSKRQ